MSVVFATNPAELFTVCNQVLVYSCYETGSMGAGFRFVVWVSEYDDTTLKEIAKLYISANTELKGHFDLSEIVKDRLKVDDNQGYLGAVIHKEQRICVSQNNSRKYKIDIGSYTTAGGEGSVQASKYIYLIDGAFQVTSGLEPSFADFYPTSIVTGSWKKAFLTDRWSDLKVKTNLNAGMTWNMGDDDEAVIAWIHDSNIIGGIDDKLSCDFYDSAGVLIGSSNFLIDAIGGNALTDTNYNEKVHYAGVGPKNIVTWATFNPVTNPDWGYYMIRLKDNKDQCSKYLKVVRDCTILRGQRVQLAYTNRLGGWDYLVFDGFNTKSETKTDKPYIKHLGDWSDSTYHFIESSRELASAQILTTKSYSLKTNRFTSQDFYLLQGALRSDNVMIRFVGGSEFVEDNDKWLPVNIKDSSYEIRDFGNAKIYDVKVKVELAQIIRC